MEIEITPVDQKKVNKLIYDCLWDLKNSLKEGDWLYGRLDLYLPQIKEAMQEKKICIHCRHEI